MPSDTDLPESIQITTGANDMNRKTAPYGTFSDYPKIDIFNRHTGSYVCSTTWARTCKEALFQYADTGAHRYKAHFA